MISTQSTIYYQYLLLKSEFVTFQILSLTFPPLKGRKLECGHELLATRVARGKKSDSIIKVRMKNKAVTSKNNLSVQYSYWTQFRMNKSFRPRFSP